MDLTSLFAGSELRTNVAFGVAAGCCFVGFLTAIVMYAYYGFVLQKDMAGGVQALTYIFVGQGFGGMIAALFKSPSTDTSTTATK